MTRVVFMGTPEFAVPSLAALLSEGYDVVGVLTREDQPAGRGQHLVESPVKKLARAVGLPVLQPRTLRDPETQAGLALLAPELIVVAAYGLLIPQPLLDLPTLGCLNVHGSVLPRYRGAAPITAAILAGDRTAGISIMRMDAGIDTGPVLSTASIAIAPDDTTGSLSGKLATLGAQRLVLTLPGWLHGDIIAQPQSDDEASYAPRITKDAGVIDWHQPASSIARQIRAYQPWPSAFTTWRGLRLKIARAYAEDAEDTDCALGQVVSRPEQVGVVTGAGVLWLIEVQLEGKRMLPIGTFLRGAPAFANSRLPS
jgi:methionyl-tRNA formyltransferase